MPAFLETQKFARQELGYAEGAQVEQILGLRLNQALIGEMSPAKALNTAAKEIEELFRKNGRTTGRCRRCPNKHQATGRVREYRPAIAARASARG